VQVRLPRAVARPLAVAVQLGLAGLLGACSDYQPSEPLARAADSVIGGVQSTPTFDNVVSFSSGSTSCSGAMVAPNVVLTALHCIAEEPQGNQIKCNPDGTASLGGELGPLRDTAVFSIYTGVFPSTTPAARSKKLFGTGSMNACSQDLGLIVLDRDLDVPITPLRFDRPAVEGELMRVIGYGQSDDTTQQGRLERADVEVRSLGTDGQTQGDAFSAPYTIVVGEGPCFGDSGSPLLSMETNAAVGVASIVYSMGCKGPGVTSAYTQIAPFEDLIREALTYAGHEPVLEPTGGTGGTTGMAGAAGDPGTGEGGAIGEGGASTGATGGTEPGVGGSSAGTGGSGAVVGSGGSDPQGEGSGSRNDPSCACHTTGTRRSAPPGAAALALLAFLYRRRARRHGPLART
jgi:MYXO-CTERM domain-containing protein